MWREYEGALIPTVAPHETLTPVFTKAFWKDHSRALFARWTSDYDCPQETNWWYIVKDTPFDIAALKAKRRYEINKGIRHFDVREIDPIAQKENLFSIAQRANLARPKENRPKFERDSFMLALENGGYYKAYAAFDRNSDAMCGYVLLRQTDRCINICVLKSEPQYESEGINAAMVYAVLKEHQTFLSENGYVCDGERNVFHETAFQEYLMKYFEFRKVYCRLNIAYNPRIKWLVNCLYPFRKMIKKRSKSRLTKKISAVLKMEEITRA